MGLFGKASLFGNSMKKREEQRQQNVAAMAQSGIVKFAKNIGDPVYEKIAPLEGVDNLYTNYPADTKIQNLINDAAVRIVQVPEHAQILSSSIVYFAMLENWLGQSPNYTIVTSKGIFLSGLLRKFIPVDNIKEINLNKDCIGIDEKEGRYIPLPATYSKKIRSALPGICETMKKIYNQEM